MNNTPIFFLHIPKAAGMSLRSFLIDQYQKDQILAKYDWNSLTIDDLHNLSNYRLIMGHFDYRMCQHLPVGYKIITFLREPIARTVSAIQHAMRDSNFRPIELDFKQKTFKESIRDHNIMQWFANTQVNLLSLAFDLELANARLKSFDFVGIVEQYEQDFLQLTNLCNFYPPVTTPLINTKPQQDKSLQLDDEDIAILTSYNELDIQLYQQAIAISQSQIIVQREVCLNKYFESRPSLTTDTFINLAPPFSGWGFYKLQQDNNSTYRWSGSAGNYSGISLKLASGNYKIKILYYLVKDKFASDIEISVNGQNIEAILIAKEDDYCEFVLTIPKNENESAIIEFVFKTDKINSPSIYGEPDLRMLGFLLIGIDIKYSA